VDALFDCRGPYLYRAVGFHDEQQMREMNRKLKAEEAAGVVNRAHG